MSVCVCVCLCVCLSARISLKPHAPSLPIFVHVAYGRGSVLLRRRCDTLCNSGFVDDIMFFFYNGPYSGMNFPTKDRFRLNLLRTEFNFLLLNLGIILTILKLLAN